MGERRGNGEYCDPGEPGITAEWLPKRPRDGFLKVRNRFAELVTEYGETEEEKEDEGRRVDEEE